MDITNLADLLKRAENEVTTTLQDPAVMAQAAEQIGQLPPELRERARRMAASQGPELLQELRRRGLDPKEMRKQMKQLKKGQTRVPGQRVIVITRSRQIRGRMVDVPWANFLRTVLQTEEAVEAHCRRLAQGPLQGKEVRAWYNGSEAGRNRRATKILGFPVGGEVVIAIENESLTDLDFEAAEKCIGD